MTLLSPLVELKGIGPAVAHKYAVLGVKNIHQLLTYFPRRYDDYSIVSTISQLKPGPVSVEVVFKQVGGRYVRRGLHITEAIASDSSGSVRIIWFNQPYRATGIKIGPTYYVSGQYELSHQRFAIMNASAELESDFPINTARIVPIYKETKGLTSRHIRATVKQALLEFDLPETLPDWLIEAYKVMSYAEAVQAVHFPESTDQLTQAQRRLGFEEVFQLSLASLLNKQSNNTQRGVRVPYETMVARKFVARLPFTLTDDQKRAADRIFKDLASEQPMNRLLEGDVGSGKTVVAAMAAAMVIASGGQVALMAPTELLARQHERTLKMLLEHAKDACVVDLLVGSLSLSHKKKVRAALQDGSVQCIVGTQALITDLVDMHSLVLIVIDEQHRFGVEQRKSLQAKAKHMPHVLNLTATPIPRSLALTLYGELDISVLSAKPDGRLPIITEIVSPNSTAQLYEKLDSEMSSGRQIYIVCPLITDSTTSDVQSVEKTYERLRTHEFKHRSVGILHGKMKPSEKQKIMQQFVSGAIEMLVATTVIEVGVDVPNASVMVIENADRFGLAQLHQLRGRVGRGSEQGYCHLVMSDSKAPSRRLRALETSNDGFRLAEMDLEMRGPGAIYGSLQHGQLDLRVAKLTDAKLIASAREAAQIFIERDEKLLHYKELSAKVSSLRAVTNLN